jgi:hypothetical protein
LRVYSSVEQTREFDERLEVESVEREETHAARGTPARGTPRQHVHHIYYLKGEEEGEGRERGRIRVRFREKGAPKGCAKPQRERRGGGAAIRVR